MSDCFLGISYRLGNSALVENQSHSHIFQIVIHLNIVQMQNHYEYDVNTALPIGIIMLLVCLLKGLFFLHITSDCMLHINIVELFE